MKELLFNKVENFVVKGEIAHYKQFLLLLHCFKRNLLVQKHQKGYKVSIQTFDSCEMQVINIPNFLNPFPNLDVF